MDLQARYLVFHSVVVLVVGLLVFSGNALGIGASTVGTAGLLYAAYVSLR